jgi:hypothetical protein
MDKDNVRELCEARQALEKIGEKWVMNNLTKEIKNILKICKDW